MSIKKKRIAKRLGASALAVATIASGLSFGMPALAAEDQATSTTSGPHAEFDSSPGPLVLRDPATGKYWSTARFAGSFRAFDDLAAAVDYSRDFVYNSQTKQIWSAKGCLAVGGQRWLVQTTCVDDEWHRFTFEDGHLHNDAFPSEEISEIFYVTSDIIHPKYTPEGDAFEVVVAPGLQLAAEWKFQEEREQRSLLSGTGKPGAAIAVDDASGQEVASTTVDEDGVFSVEIDAPNSAGTYALTVKQSLDGSDLGTTKVELDYGKAVVITGPEDQEEVPAGATAITGEGEPGSMVQVFDNAGRNPVVSASVRANGTWSGAANLGAGQHQLEAKQLSKGANTTTSTITVNPGDSIVDLTADGRFDATDPTKPAVAHGSAPAGSTVILRNSVDTEIGRTVASADDTYEIEIDPSKATTGVNTFSAIVEGDAGNAKSFTLDYGSPAAPVVVTTPAQNGTVEPGTVRFAGTGQAGSKIVVRGSSRQVATATVNAQGAWSADSTVELSKGAYNLYFDQIGKGGLKSTMQHAFTIGESAPIVTPVTVTSPGADEVLDTLTPEFRGTGHEGATITVRGSSRVVATGTVRNGQWVANTNAASPLAPGTYNLYVDQAIRGTVTSTIRIAFTVSNEAFRELTLSAPAQNENVTVLRPTFVGTATPGAEIRVGSSRTTVATATVGADGTWRATAEFDLQRGGTYAGLEVKQTTKTGKTSTTSSSFTVDRNAQ